MAIAEVSVDFGTLLRLSRVARDEYGMAGAVQHGASTLPESAFGKFVESEACEVHLATNFQNMLFDRLPPVSRGDVRLPGREERRRPQAGMTDEQFYYKTRKNAIGPFKRQVWQMPAEKRAEIGAAWEEQFKKLFTYLAVGDTRRYVEQTIQPLVVKPSLKAYLGESATKKTSPTWPIKCPPPTRASARTAIS
jgi:hypothetical protein